MNKFLATLFLAATLSLGFGCAHKGNKECSGKKCDMTKKDRKHDHKEGKKCDLKDGKKSCCDHKKKS